ncbi:kinase-like domain-containing protein [Coprinopsis sp. MPI-PUGE-AT-0042]|nr:kinase-like domain-containing protein [Coprinopsis sp. MPI-PUGE-AT-0042]
MPNIPTEVFQLIIEAAWDPSFRFSPLTSIRLTCHMFNDLACPLVYRRITFRNRPRIPLFPAIRRIQALLAWSQENPSLLHHIRALHLYVFRPPLIESWLAHPCLSSLVAWLRQGTKFRELAIFSVSGTSALLLSVFQPIAPKITTLYLEGIRNISHEFFTEFRQLQTIHVRDAHALPIPDSLNTVTTNRPRILNMTYTSILSKPHGSARHFLSMFDLSELQIASCFSKYFSSLSPFLEGTRSGWHNLRTLSLDTTQGLTDPVTGVLQFPRLEQMVLRHWGRSKPMRPFSPVKDVLPFLHAPHLNRIRLDAIFPWYTDKDILEMDWSFLDTALSSLAKPDLSSFQVGTMVKGEYVIFAVPPHLPKDRTRYVLARDIRNGLAVKIRIVSATILSAAGFQADIENFRSLLDVSRAIIRLADHFGLDDHYFLVFPLEGKSLEDVVSDTNIAQLSSRQIKEIIRQIVDALDHIHETSLVHSDLHPGTVIFTNPATTDEVYYDASQGHFATRSVLRSTELRLHWKGKCHDPNLMFGSDGYRAPEVILGAIPTIKADYFSLGCIMAELITAGPLFPRCESKSEDYIRDSLLMMEHMIGDFPEDMSERYEQAADLFDDAIRVIHGHDVCFEVENFLDTAETLENCISDIDSFDVITGILHLDPVRRKALAGYLSFWPYFDVI